MAVVGLKLVTLALLDDKNQVVTGNAGLSENGLFPITNDMLGTKEANISNITSSPTMIYGNDSQTDASIAKGTPSVAFDFNSLPAAVKNKILGRVNDGKGGYTQGKMPHVAALIQTTEISSLNAQYIGFASGVMNETAQNLQTNTNAESRVDDALTYTAFGVSRWNGEAIKFYDGGDANFSEDGMYAEVFAGYTPATGSTSQTSAPAPSK